MRRRVVAGLGGATVLFLATAVLLSAKSVPGLIEVEDVGHHVLPDLPAGVEVARVRVAGLVTIYVDLARGNAEDAVTGVLLTAMGTAAVMTGLLLSGAGAARRLVRCYLVFGAAMAFLAADELLSLHETIGYSIERIFPGIDRANNLIVALYALLAVAGLIAFRRELWRGRARRVLFVAAAAIFALSVVFDILKSSAEEPAEVLAALCVVVGFLTLLADDLGAQLRVARSRRPDDDWVRARPASNRGDVESAAQP
jgi:hypothetical protein